MHRIATKVWFKLELIRLEKYADTRRTGHDRPALHAWNVLPSLHTFRPERTVMTRLAVGALPPPFTLPNQDGRATSLSDFAGRHVLVWFFSRAFGSN